MEEVEKETSICFYLQYDELNNGENSIDLAEFGESLQGFSKVLACAGNFVATGQYNRRYTTLPVTVSTTAKLEQGCIEIPVWISNHSSEIFSGLGGSVLTVVANFILSRRGKAEMEHLANALNQALQQNKENAERNKEITDSLIATINRMADGLSAASCQALAPIGKSCRTISMLDKDKHIECFKIDEQLKEAITRQAEQQISKEQEYSGKITELDLVTGNCKIALYEDDEDDRVNGTISDPALSIIPNAYVDAFASGKALSFRAKAQLSQDGDIVKLHISDTVKNV